jgi:hypothetical protein
MNAELEPGNVNRRSFLKWLAAGIVVTVGAGVGIDYGLKGWPFHKTTEIPTPVSDTYDPSLESQVVEAEVNARPASTQEKSSAFTEATRVAGGNQAHPEDTFLYPVPITDGDRATISFVPASIPFLNDYTNQEETLIQGVGFSIPKKGDKIFLPITNGEVFQIASGNQGGKSYYGGLIIRFTDKANNPCELRITGLDLVDQENLKPFGAAANAPIIGSNGFVGRFQQTNLKGIMLEGGTEIMETTKDNVVGYMDVVVMNPLFSHVKINFATSDDGKLLYIDSNSIQ